MTDTTTPGAGDHISRAAMSTGSMLRDAREAAGLTLDMVAQQLKLAPRQVIALEEGDYGSLPGRTFVRGFVRNYARLLHIDADHVLAGLPGSDTDALHSPVLHPTAPTIGDLPTEDKIKPGWTRWAIPVALVVVIASGVLYEFTRGRSEIRPAPATTATEPEQKTSVSLASAPATPPADSVPLTSPIAAPHTPPAGGTAASASSVTAAGSQAPTPPGRSNPISSTAPAPAVTPGAIGASALPGVSPGITTPVRQPAPQTANPAPPAPATTAAPGRTAAPSSAAPAPPASTVAPPPATRSSPATTTTAASPPPPPRSTPLSNPFSNPLSNPFAGSPSSAPPAPAAAPGTVTMVLTLRKASRTEVKDATGRAVLSETVPAGQTRTVTGTPPFDVVISNATDATLTYRGKQIDISPYTRQKVARFRLL